MPGSKLTLIINAWSILRHRYLKDQDKLESQDTGNGGWMLGPIRMGGTLMLAYLPTGTMTIVKEVSQSSRSVQIPSNFEATDTAVFALYSQV
jgi:hypothetical protein